jgi:glycosyltransferase involved in cell wall biosynthesis
MRVVYSIGATFAGGGIGTTAYHGVRGLYRHGMLASLLCTWCRPTEIPSSLVRTLGLVDRALRKAAVYDDTRHIHFLHCLLFDQWASRRIGPGEIFYTWAIHGLRSMRRARELGRITVLHRGSTHPRHAERVLRQEYERRGKRLRRPRSFLARSCAEVDEADFLAYSAEFTADTYRREGVPEHKLIRARYGADLRRFHPARRPPGSNFRVLFLGKVGLGKGALYLLEAWKKLGWRDAEVVLAGHIDNDTRPLLEPFRKLPGVRFPGYVDAAAAFREADVFALPSLYEESAKAAFEAMACGLPVVVTAETGAPVRDGVEGLLVPPCDAESLAAALERLRTDEHLRREMGRAARARVEEGFTWDGYGDRLVAALQGIAGAA